MGCVGSLLRLALFDVFLGGMGCWIVGVQWGRGSVFCGAAYYLRDECHILNILWGDGV